MKKISLILLLSATFVLSALAQGYNYTNWEDVVYLKNGNVVRGIIVEQVPGQTIKVQTTDGQTSTFMITEIQKFGKEKVTVTNMDTPPPGNEGVNNTSHPPMPPYPPMPGDSMHQGGPACGHDGMCNRGGMGWGMREHKEIPFKKGYFGQVQMATAGNMRSLHIVNGYKKCPLGFIGVGVGIDYLYRLNEAPRTRNGNPQPFYGDMTNGQNRMDRFMINNRRRESSTWMVPVFVHYEAEFSHRRIVPVFFAELGYAVPLKFTENYSFTEANTYLTHQGERTNYGAIYGSDGLGLKFKTAHRFNVSVLFDVKMFAHVFKFSETTYNPYITTAGNYYTNLGGTAMNLDIKPGGRLVFGF